MSTTHYQTESVNGINIFYREAGSSSQPGLLLLHGHASSSHTFRNIIPELSKYFHVIAPDYPGFGNSDRPDPRDYKYTFINLAEIIDKFTEQIGLTRFNIYIFDFGAPIGLQLAQRHPERVIGIFTQSGNAYEEGLAAAFDGVKEMWAAPDDESKVEPLKAIFKPEGIQYFYKVGVSNPESISPDAPCLDTFFTTRPGAIEIQLLLLRDYENNVKTYPKWQAYLREHKPKVIGVWGDKDPFFAAAGAEAFKRDVPDADITVIDGGHFLNESNPGEIIQGLKKLL